MALPRSKADRLLALAQGTQPLGDQYEVAVNAAMRKIRDIAKVPGPSWQYVKNLSKLQDLFHDHINAEVARIRAEKKGGDEV